MKTCICSQCKHLKDSVQDDVIVEVCIHGFPDESCETCAADGCDLTCAHYEAEVEEAMQATTCVTCGKVLYVASSNDEEGAVYCPMCYLTK